MGNIEQIDPKIFEKILQDTMYELISKASPVNSPKAYLLGGQPGAGKTTIADILATRHRKNIILINGDDFRKLHPVYHELYKMHGDHAVLETQKFAGQMTESLIDRLSGKKYNLIIEGTLCTTDIPLKTKDLLVKKGYGVELSLIVVRPEVSYLSTLKRYELMKEAGTIPRMTPKAHHDLVVKNIIQNLNTLYQSKAFDNITLYNREKKCLYSYKDTPLLNPSLLLSEEFCRSLTRKEFQALKFEYGNYIPCGESIEQIFNPKWNHEK